MNKWLVIIAVSLVAACVDPGAGAREGNCVFNDDCPAGQVCAGQSCRLACRSDGDCINGFQCRSTSQPGKLACLPPDAPLFCADDRACADAGLLCGNAGLCVPECMVDRDCWIFHRSMQCVGAARDAGRCEFGPSPGADASSSP